MIGPVDSSGARALAPDSSASPRPAVVVLDAGALATLRDLFAGDTPALRDLLQTYLTSSAQLCDDMHHGARRADLATIGRAAHTLKSSSAIFGATELAGACRTLEVAAGQGDVAAAVALVHATLSAYTAARAAIAAIAPDHPEQ